MKPRAMVFLALATGLAWTMLGHPAGTRGWNPSADPTATFRDTVAPILVKHCLPCHGSETRKGGLSLATRADALAGGDSGPALVAGRPDESPLFTKTVPTQPGTRPEMPLKRPALPEADTAKLRAWIASGAAWPAEMVLKERAKADQGFWSLQPLATVSPPPADAAPAAWRTNAIDAFIWSKLREHQLEPNPPAGPREFIRRATYDLLGLPPTEAEVAAFAAACAEDRSRAVARLIDRLLASPHYGERWGRHWLDVVRFGESRGYERNEIITNLWPFRDYVIRSFNDDKPFDEFIREHLAGDVLAAGRPEVEVGAAFLVAGPYDDVGNQDAAAAARIRADQMDEMIRATGEAFLGVTMGCARCHDHKFDPITQADYHAWYASFAGVVHGAREVATPAEQAERAARLQPLQQRQRQLQGWLAAWEKERTARVQVQEAEAAKAWTRPPASRYLTEETFTPTLAQYVRLVVDGTDAPDGRGSEFKIDEFEIWTDEPTPRNVALAANGASAKGAARAPKDFAGAYGPALVIDGQFGERWHAAGRELVITLPRPERIQRVVFSSDRLRELGPTHFLTTFVGDYRVEVSVDGSRWREVANSLSRQPATVSRKVARLEHRVATVEDLDAVATLRREIQEVETAMAKVPALPVWWVGTRQPAPGPFHVFLGGDPQRRGPAIVPASLQVLAERPGAYRLSHRESEGERRLALARWITAPENPLTPRVLANRVWHYHFGTGLVDTPSDFGYMGSRPTHPELLDALARELLQSGWRLKPLHRLIMTSQAYQQSSASRPDAAARDTGSRWLWRFPPRRLSAEEVRDTMLLLAGKLDRRMGGPGFRLYDYQQDNVATYVPLENIGPETYRRAVYHHNARAARVDVLSDFDCPDPAFAEPRRAGTTTPLQALTLLNHRFGLDMAEAFAARVRAEAAATGADPIDRAFAIAFQRRPTEAERDAALQLVARFSLRALARALLNSNELLYVE